MSESWCLMKIVPGFLLREVAGRTYAVPTNEAAQHLSGLMELNGSGKFLFDLLQKEQTEAQLLQTFLQSYDTDAETAKADIREFLSCLEEHHLLLP